MASRALTTRLMITRSLCRSARTSSSSARAASPADVFVPISRRSIMSISATISFNEDARLQHLTAAEGEQLPGERRCLLAARWTRSRAATARRRVPRSRTGVPGDRRQQVVEVVRSLPARRPTAHLLRPA
jgi:hypothetical protein